MPELCAAILVGRFPERYGLKVEQLPPYAYETVEVDRMTSLPVLARFADTDVDALKELNPELLRATTPPGRYTLRVPPGQSGVTARALARIPASQRLDFKAYKVRRGESLARVAARFNLSAEDLLDANNITKAQFRPGRVIQVPPPPASPIDDRDLRSRVERAQTIEDRPLETLPAIPRRPGRDAGPGRRERRPPETVVDRHARSPRPPASLPAPGLPAPERVPGPAPAGPHPRPAPADAPAPWPGPPPARPGLPDAPPQDALLEEGRNFAIAVRYGQMSRTPEWNKVKGNKIRPASGCASRREISLPFSR